MATFDFQTVLVWTTNPGGVVRLLRNGAVTVYNAATDAVLFNLTSDSAGLVSFTTTDVTTVYLKTTGWTSEHITAASAVEAAAGFTVSEDTAVTALLTTPGTQLNTAANSTFARAAMGRPGNRWVALGDSITIGSSSPGGVGNADSFPTYASLMSQQRLNLVRNAGVGGNTSAQMLARFSTDVTPFAPNVVTILAGTNDTGQSVPLATFQANIKAIVAKCLAIGALPVLATMPPNGTGTPAGRSQQVLLFNAWIRRYAQSIGASVVDFYRQLVNPVTQGYLSQYDSGDHTHPNAAGYALMGQVLSNTIAPLLPSNAPLLPQDGLDQYNLLPNSLFLTAAAGGYPSGWTPGSNPTGVALALVSDPAVPGQMFKITATSSSNLYALTLASPITAGFSAGDVLALTGLVTADGGVAAVAKINYSGGISNTGMNIAQAVTRGAYYLESTVPAGTTNIQFVLQAAAGTGVVQFGQVGLYNLTTMGV